MAYDRVRGSVVLFGGGQGPLLNDTWLWDGESWAAQHPANRPSARQNSAIAFDAGHGQTLLVGGTNLDPSLADTWTWDGADWHLMVPATGPKGSFLSVDMFYYTSKQTVLLIVNPGPTIGHNGSKSFSPSELWVWR
jgi:hypothetical protein